jgi:hypothetical protein
MNFIHFKILKKMKYSIAIIAFTCLLLNGANAQIPNAKALIGSWTSYRGSSECGVNTIQFTFLEDGRFQIVYENRGDCMHGEGIPTQGVFTIKKDHIALQYKGLDSTNVYPFKMLTDSTFQWIGLVKDYHGKAYELNAQKVKENHTYFPATVTYPFTDTIKGKKYEYELEYRSNDSKIVLSQMETNPKRLFKTVKNLFRIYGVAPNTPRINDDIRLASTEKIQDYYMTRSDFYNLMMDLKPEERWSDAELYFALTNSKSHANHSLTRRLYSIPTEDGEIERYYYVNGWFSSPFIEVGTTIHKTINGKMTVVKNHGYSGHFTIKDGEVIIKSMIGGKTEKLEFYRDAKNNNYLMLRFK